MTDERANVLPSDCFQEMGELSCGDLVMVILKALRPLQPGGGIAGAATGDGPKALPTPAHWQFTGIRLARDR